FPISSVLSSDIRNASTRITRSSIANPKLASILSTLSKPYGSVREIVEPRKPHPYRILIYVQDVHKNYEAQSNIAHAVKDLIENRTVDFIGLEGGFKPFDLTAFHSFHHPDIISKMAQVLLKENKISGPIYAALTSTVSIPPVFGIDDQEHHKANVDAYLSSVPQQESEFRRLALLQK